MRPLTAAATAALLAVLLAGCLSSTPSETPGRIDDAVNATPTDGPIDVDPTDALDFAESVVAPAVGHAHGLYEPTVSVSDTGAIYVAGHVNGVLTTGTPAYVSTDGGGSWQQLPFLGPARAPGPVQNGAPPNGDEGFIVPGDDGRAWMVDITLDRFPVTGYCDDGAEQCFHTPNAYDRAGATASPATADCNAATSLNDRPWAAYANGTLLMVNNPGVPNRVQVGVMDVPPDLPTDPVPPEWNLCATGDGRIPGVPAMRDDGRFAVPHISGGTLRVVTGNVDDVHDTTVTPVFEAAASPTADYGDPHNWGRAAFDAEGTLYVGALVEVDGGVTGLRLAVSQDGGRNFTTRTYDVGRELGFFYLAGNPSGPGAIATWTQTGDQDLTADFHAAHLRVGPDGQPALSKASLVADEVHNPRGDVYGSAVGPDGRAHLAVYTYPGTFPQDIPGYAGTNPLSVYIQQDGPALPTG